MSLPRFTAENSLYKSPQTYSNISGFYGASSGIIPQAVRTKYCTFTPLGMICLDRKEVAILAGLSGGFLGVEGGGGGFDLWGIVGGILGAIIGFIGGLFVT